MDGDWNVLQDSDTVRYDNPCIRVAALLGAGSKLVVRYGSAQYGLVLDGRETARVLAAKLAERTGVAASAISLCHKENMRAPILPATPVTMLPFHEGMEVYMQKRLGEEGGALQIKFGDGSVQTIVANASMTVGQLKQRICEIGPLMSVQVPTEPNAIELLWDKYPLKVDTKTLDDLGVWEDATFDCLLMGSHNQEEGRMQLFVKTLSGKTVALFMWPCETIASLSLKIYWKTDVLPQTQRLIWRGRQLANRRTFADYGIEKEETIHLLTRVSSLQRTPHGIWPNL